MLKGKIKRNNKDLYFKINVKNPNSRFRYERVCFYCKVEFLSNRKTALYCCDNHRLKHFRQQKKEEAEKKEENTIKDIKMLFRQGYFNTGDLKLFLKD